MAAVVAVHGAFHELWGPHQVAGRWIPALRDGLALADGAVDVEPDDVAIAFYGDVFRADPEHPIDDDELRVLAERSGILDAATAMAGPDGLEAFMAHIGAEQVRRTLAQLGRYLAEDAVRDEVHARVRAVVGDDTRVVVAHSLGSVVAYEVLATMPGPARIDLVTIGSPLGHPEVIGPGLRPPVVDGAGQWPAVVRNWTNVTAAGDPVADGRPLAARFDGVVERRIDNGHRHHDPEPYLCARVTGDAVAGGLRSAGGAE